MCNLFRYIHCKEPDEDEWYFTDFEKDVNGDRETFFVESIEGLTVLGRPIRLADVLLATPAQYRGEEMQWVGMDVVSKWNLEDDNLDHQSEGTKQSLINLLVQ